MNPSPTASLGIDHLWVEEAGEGSAVLCVHGLGGTSTYYEPLARTLSPSHRVVRFDLAGHGRSALGPSGPPSIGGWVDDALAVLDSRGIERASVVGHSMGTLVVQRLAANHPERVDRLVLLGAVRAQPEAAKAATRQRAATVREGGMGAVADGIVSGALAENVQAERPEIVGFVRELLLGQDPAGYALACEALAAAEGPEPSSIAAETLLVTGKEDKVSPPDAVQELASALPRARVVVLDGCGHWAALERADEVDALVRRFLSKPRVAGRDRPDGS